MPTTCRPSLPYLFWNSMNQGISILQGPHHVAQKSSRITLPLNADSFTSLLERSFSVKFRFAGFALAGQALAATPAGVSDTPMASRWGPGKSAFNVNRASASALTAAMAQRIPVVISSSRLRASVRGSFQRRLQPGRQPLDLLLRLFGDEDERTFAVAPDRGTVSQN